jgi:hypothetical protein
MESLFSKLAGIKYTTHLMLPLTGVSWFSVSTQLIETWLSQDKQHLIAHTTVKIPVLASRRSGATNIEYLGEVEGVHLYRLAIAEIYHKDVLRFLKGQYSKFSRPAIEAINALSGLPYKVYRKEEGLTHVHVLLAAIDRELTIYRADLARQLSVEIYGDDSTLDPDGELLSPPEAREQVFYPHS